MAKERIPGKPIQAGYEWTFRITFKEGGLTFEPDAEFIAQVRREPQVPEILATMSTANGGIVRHDERTLDLILTGEQSDGWPDRKVYIDIVQTDLDPMQHLGFRLTVPVSQPITRGL